MKTTQKTQTTGQKIKAAIKAAGIPTKAISVKTSYPGYEEVITITVKDVFIDLEDVKKIARPFESIDYDERCQEVLQGGNTFVRVSYDYAAEQAATKALEPLAAEIIKYINTHPAGVPLKVCAPNGAAVEVLTFTNSDHWTIYTPDHGITNIDHRRHLRPADYYPEDLPHAVARALFDFGARFVNLIPDPEPTPDPEPINKYYIVAAGVQSFTGYAVTDATTDKTTAEAWAESYIDSEIESGNPAPVCYVVTRSHILARVDNKGIHAPKDRPQRTPSKVLLTLDAYDLRPTKTA